MRLFKRDNKDEGDRQRILGKPFEQSLKINAKDDVAWFNNGNSLASLGHFDENQFIENVEYTFVIRTVHGTYFYETREFNTESIIE